MDHGAGGDFFSASILAFIGIWNTNNDNLNVKLIQ